MKTAKGTAWWESLHHWQKMAVVLHFPKVRAKKLAKELELESRNPIIGVRTRINDRQRLGKELPEPCSPEEVGELLIPAEELIISGRKGKRKKTNEYIQKPQPEINEPFQAAHPKPLNSDKPRFCCEAGCTENAVPKLAFCPVHARLHYVPMTPQIEALIIAVT